MKGSHRILSKKEYASLRHFVKDARTNIRNKKHKNDNDEQQGNKKPRGQQNRDTTEQDHDMPNEELKDQV